MEGQRGGGELGLNCYFLHLLKVNIKLYAI